MKLSLAVVEQEDHGRGADEQQHRSATPGHDVVLFGGLGIHEAAVEIVHQVRGAPVEVGQNGGRVGGDQAAEHEAHPADGKEAQHRRVSDIVADQGRVQIGEGLLDIGELGVDDQRGQAHQNPRPGTQHVVSDVEEQRAAQRVLFGFRGQHALRDVAAAAGFGAGIPDGPPLHRDGNDEDGHGEIPVVGEIGQHVEIVQAARAFHHARACPPGRSIRRPAAG